MQTFEITRGQFERSARLFNEIAKSSVKVEFDNGVFWVFGSEAAISKIVFKYRFCDKVSNGYSETYGAYYFSIETPSFTGRMS